MGWQVSKVIKSLYSSINWIFVYTGNYNYHKTQGNTQVSTSTIHVPNCICCTNLRIQNIIGKEVFWYTSSKAFRSTNSLLQMLNADLGRKHSAGHQDLTLLKDLHALQGQAREDRPVPNCVGTLKTVLGRVSKSTPDSNLLSSLFYFLVSC